MKQIKVMSFNMLFGGYEGTDFSLERRKDKIIDVINRESPDIIGCQEVVDGTRAWLERSLFDKYAMIGVGRGADCRGEGCPVLYRKDKFSLLSYETFWLSENPLTPGSLASGTGQSPCPRLAHILHLKCYDNGRSLVFLNTHLDHFSEASRRFELEMLSQKLLKIPNGVLCVMTGDLNLEPDADYFGKFLKQLEPSGWKDATSELGGTFHNFGRLEEPMKIDYILTNANIFSSRIVEDIHESGIWYSDHYAVCSVLEI